ncbi:MAG TPA: RluA family pseudouridine synthase [Candidatus Binatia bacterium]|jgi:23S rRNA pseudouridine1911/1915/1917 synthase
MADARLIFEGPPTRLDRYLRDRLGHALGRRGVAVWLRDHAVRVNGRRAAKSQMLRPGDEILLPEAAPARPLLVPVATPLAIVHADGDLVAIDKPPGMPSTGGAGTAPSAAAALLQRYPEMAAIDAVRSAGLVHRLDTGTSGLLVAARTPAAYARVRDAFAQKSIVKEYWAVVVGRLAEGGRITTPLDRRPRSRKRMIAAAPGRGWPAETEYLPLVHAGDLTLVRLRMRTGVTHQLRVHLAELGHPVLGDRRYGAVHPDAPAEWHYLHARRMTGDDRTTLGAVLAAPTPPHWEALCARLAWPLARLAAD